MADIKNAYEEFKKSSDTLRIYSGDRCIFQSDKDVLAPLVEYISKNGTKNPLIVFDKVIGNAAALLAVKAGARTVYSPLGSELGTRTLNANKVEHHLEKTVPFILARNGVDICPMEKLSIDKTPDEFYDAVKGRFLNPSQKPAESC
jgi:hypothetical protein